MKVTWYIAVFALLLGFSVAHAHQPRIVDGDVIAVSNPDVSQAFYATLRGGEDVYTIEIEEEIPLLLQVLTPVIESREPQTFTYTLTLDGEVLHESKPYGFDTIFHEEFAGDDYYEGPLFEEVVQPGSYTVYVRGEVDDKYVFVVGKKELFPPSEILNTIVTLPELKTQFFEKPLYSAFTNIVGVMLLVMLTILSLLVWLIVVFVRKLRST